ncbi:MAG: tyrosine-type recombinase/integrase [Terracidiphilus sp.]
MAALPMLVPCNTAPDKLAALRLMLVNAVVSRHSKRAYAKAFDSLFALAGDRPISRALLLEYRAQMVDQGLSASTINLRLSAIRKLVREARDNGIIDPAEGVRITSVPGVPQQGIRLGNWLTREEIRRLLAVPDRTRLIGKRSHAILSLLVYCAVRREEAATLQMSRIQMREGRWVIADLVGKRGRVRTVAIPKQAKAALDEWTNAAAILSGSIFRHVLKNGRALNLGLSAWAIWDVVVTTAAKAGIGHLGPHDLRRTSAKQCRKAGGDLEQVQFLLGHEDLSTTARYLNSTQDIRAAVNDRLSF